VAPSHPLLLFQTISSQLVIEIDVLVEFFNSLSLTSILIAKPIFFQDVYDPSNILSKDKFCEFTHIEYASLSSEILPKLCNHPKFVAVDPEYDLAISVHPPQAVSISQ
jgi:hypothetical protein